MYQSFLKRSRETWEQESLKRPLFWRYLTTNPRALDLLLNDSRPNAERAPRI